MAHIFLYNNTLSVLGVIIYTYCFVKRSYVYLFSKLVKKKLLFTKFIYLYKRTHLKIQEDLVCKQSYLATSIATNRRTVHSQ